eukprot:235467-Pyramimonas_sp.AAC.1
MAIPAMTEFWIREDCAPATQWTRERILLECCCGSQSRIGDPTNFVDNPCKVIRYTEKEDMRTNEGLSIALNGINTFKGNILRCGVLCLAREALPGNV